MCTAGMAMPGSASSSYGCMPSHIQLQHFLLKMCTKALLSRPTPPSTCQGLFRWFMSAVWPLGIPIPPFSDNFYPHFHWISLTFHQYVDLHTHTHLFGHHHPPSSIWAILSLYGPVPSPIYWVFTNKSNFHHTSSIFHWFFDFSHTCMPVLVITTHPGLPSHCKK